MIKVRVKYWDDDSFSSKRTKLSWEVEAESIDQAIEFLNNIKEHNELQKEHTLSDNFLDMAVFNDEVVKKPWGDKQFLFSGMRFGGYTKTIPWDWTTLISAKVVIGFDVKNERI